MFWSKFLLKNALLMTEKSVLSAPKACAQRRVLPPCYVTVN